MIKFTKTPLQEILDSIPKYGMFSNSSDLILSKYVYPAIVLGICPIMDSLPNGRYCIAGGVFRSLFNNEIPTDVDIFPLDPPTNIIVDIINNAAANGHEVSSSSLTIRELNSHVDIASFLDNKYEIQVISKYITENNGTTISPKSVDDILSTFDIIPACFGIDISLSNKSFILNKICIHPNYFYSVSNKLLLLNLQKSDLYEKRMTADRFYKYIVNYGFRIPDSSTMIEFNKLLSKPLYNVSSSYV